MNLAGILLLAARSVELGETAFVAVNAVTAAFWALALVVKALEDRRAPASARSAPLADAAQSPSL